MSPRINANYEPTHYYMKQDRQCTYKCYRRVRETIVAAEKQYYICRVCVALSSMQSACAVLYCHLWLVRLSLFFHITSNCTISEKSY